MTNDMRTVTLRDAMASFPSGVTIVTTTHPDTGHWGFTATSFCSVSMDPPLVLVCLATNAQCHSAFLTATDWRIHLIRSEHADLALQFATRGADKFSSSRFVFDEGGRPWLDGASIVLSCQTEARHPGGDHTILVGRVTDARMRDEVPVVYFRRAFHAVLDSPAATPPTERSGHPETSKQVG